jgi:amino acid transporter
MSENSLHNKILNSIKDQKPYSGWRFELLGFFIILIITILISLSILILTFFFWDVIDLCVFTRSDWVSILGAGLFELIFIIFAMIGVTYYLYRRTDFIYVKNKSTVLISIIAIILGASLAGLITIQNTPPIKRIFQSVAQRIEDKGYRKGRRNRPVRILPQPSTSLIYNRNNEFGILES